MNDVAEILAIGFATALVFSLPFIFVGFLRYMRYKERIALARNGVAPAAPSQPSGGTSSLLRWGIMIGAIGLAMSCSLFTGLLVFTMWSGSSGPGLVLIVTPLAFLVLLPVFFGGAMMLIYWMNQRAAAAAADEPVPPHKSG